MHGTVSIHMQFTSVSLHIEIAEKWMYVICKMLLRLLFLLRMHSNRLMQPSGASELRDITSGLRLCEL
jgi:hypothetical protein